MKRAILIFIALVFSAAVFAQQNVSPRLQRQKADAEKRQEQMQAKLTEELSLTEAQAREVMDVMERRRASLKESMKEAREEKAELLKKLREQRKANLEVMKEENERFNGEIKELLSEEQALKFDELMAQRRQRIIKNRRMHRRANIHNPNVPLNRRRMRW